MVNRLVIAKAASRIFVLLLGVVLLGGSFYWFQWRPSEAKAQCSALSKHEVTQASKVLQPNEDGKISREDVDYLVKLQEQIYQFCLRERGL